MDESGVVWQLVFCFQKKVCLRKGVSFSKENAFQNVYDEGFSPLSPLSRDDQGLPGLGEGLR